MEGPAQPAWRDDPGPHLRELAATAGSLADAPLSDALRHDQASRWRRGELVPVEAYLAWVPPLRGREAVLLDLITQEVLLRQEQHEDPRADEYERRFPNLSEKIQFLFGPGTLPAGPTEAYQHSHTSSGEATAGLNDTRPAEMPDRLGRYQILGLLGEGGFGTVYRGWDEELQREVAIKVPHRHQLAAPGITDAYLAEARVLARLDHPGIVPVYDVGRTDDGLCYLVSKYIHGRSLADRLRDGRSSATDAATLIAAVARALHHAHERGLFHRDVKPANVLLDETGRPVVVDFGLAIQAEEFGRQHAGAGTPAYMSPEQARGEGHLVDARTDVYSLGVVFYEILTGRRPFHAPSPLELLEQVRAWEPRPPRQLHAAVPRELERICLKALNKRASDRYPTAQEFAEELHLWLDRQTESGLPKGDSGPVATASASTVSILPPSGSLVPAAAVVPKGLRSFNEEDADFFLALLPGPRGRDGLPESVRFWKTRLEGRDPERTFRVGVLYGPSGCGKSSLLRAGLLPRLSPEVLPICVEAAADTTEDRLLRALRERCPGLPAQMGLAEAVMHLRRHPSASARRKVVLVLDQFEQWLHTHPANEGAELVRAIRQCDGVNVQCVLLVRDDFWMSLIRFLREVEVPLREGQNSAAVDLFDPRHARAVLAAFGRTFGNLPVDAPAGAEQERFLERAVEGLAQGGRVIPVRLSLFAEMVKGKAWTPATLKAVGGPEGIGVLFLEEAFGPMAPPEHRWHARAARAVLRELLPEAGTAIRGRVRPRQQLLDVSGYATRPADFDELLQILDGRLRLITPAEGAETDREPGYQLTHDYLVDALRRFLTAKQRETLRGRAELQLAEQAALWAAKPQSRHLPSLPEWLGSLTLTNHRDWTEPQRQLMHAATRRHTARLLGALAALFALTAGAILWRGHSQEQRAADRAAGTVERLLVAEPADLPRTLQELEDQRRQAIPFLRAAADNPDRPTKERLRAALALLPTDPERAEFVAEAALQAAPEQLRLIAEALLPYRDRLGDRLWAVVADRQRPASEHLRAAALLATLAPDDPRWAAEAAPLTTDLLAEDPLHVDHWRLALRPARRWLVGPLEASFRDPAGGEAARVLAAGLLADFAADDVGRLTGLLTAADQRSFPVLLAALRKHGQAAIDRLSAELAQPLTVTWPDQKPRLSWPPPSRDAVAAVENAGGLVNEKFALAPALPLAGLDALAADLNQAGYRPCCLRPYSTPDGPAAAVVWMRDGHAWEWLHGATPEAVRARDQDCQRKGLLPVDLAYQSGATGAGYAALWAAPTAELAESSLYLDVPLSDHQKYYGPLVDREFLPHASLTTSGPSGATRFNSVRWRLRHPPMESKDLWAVDRADYRAAAALGWCQVDLRLTRLAGDPKPRFDAIWWNGCGHESRTSPALAPAEHLSWCRKQAEQGFRSAAISAIWGSAGHVEVASVWQRPLPTEGERDATARRQALAAAALLQLGQPGPAWEMLRLGDDPRARSRLIQALPETGTDAGLLLDRLAAETDSSTRRGLLLALTGYDRAAQPADRSATVAAHFYRNDPDAGVHSAAELLLRRLGRRDDLQALDKGLGVSQPTRERGWFRNSQGQTFAIVRGPVKFLMGSPGDEPGHISTVELRHPVRIDHSYAVATKEVTVEEFMRFQPGHNFAIEYTPRGNYPATMLTWYEAAQYCRWLSEKEHVPKEEMCYPPISEIKPGMKLPADFLKRKGYRLPTEAEWEYACRAGTTTARYYGYADALLGRYAWTAANSEYRASPVGRLLPNEFGLFDILGNAMELCQDRFVEHPPSPDRLWLDAIDPMDDFTAERARRGGGFLYQPSTARAAQRDSGPPGKPHPFLGFRIVRTVD